MGLNYRLALDLGTNSIGWSMLHLDMNAQPSPTPDAVIRAGVRIFGDGRDPMSGSSLAVARREARGMRRNRDRNLDRKNRLTDVLIETGLFPADRIERRKLESFDPYALRARGLTEELTAFEFGRAIFHLNQRRGFQSNRKTDGGDKDGSLMKDSISSLRQQLIDDGYVTVGQWLAERHSDRQSVRARLRGNSARDRKYDLYFDRSMIRDEFSLLWEVQEQLNPNLFTSAKRQQIADVIFYQRNLRPVRPGRCTLEPELDRSARALASSQRFRIYQEVNNLKIQMPDFSYTGLTLPQRDLIIGKLERQKTLSFDAIRKALKLQGSPKFNLEGIKRKDLKGNTTSFILADDRRFGSSWHELSLADQDEIVVQILDEQDEGKLVAWLMEYHGLDQDAAEQTSAAQSAITSLATGFSRLSQRATLLILPHLVSAVTTYNVAVELAGYGSHSALTHAEQTGEILEQLPYYGEYLTRHVGHGTGLVSDLPADRYGRIANPTVHIALNELRKVVNTLIATYGPPAQIVLEIVRDLKLPKAAQDEIESAQAKRQDENTQYRKEIKELTGIDATRDDIQKMRLWVELNRDDVTDRCCPFTGERISIARLFSSAIEIEHILPYSRTLDDSMNNKTVAMVKANRDKGNQTPFEAFGHSPDGYDYEAILERALHMPKQKAYRFAPNGYEKWLRDDADFLARALNDTAHLSKIAKEYLYLVAPGEVWVVPGRLTSQLRRHWGLNSLLHEGGEKNRADHRHHAVDAVVIGFTDRNTLQRVAKASSQSTSTLKGISVEGPIPGRSGPEFRAKVQQVINAIVVSHRPNHGHQRQMNNDTNYGLRPDGYVALRRRLDGFDSVAGVEKANFADINLKRRLIEFMGGAEGGAFKLRLAAFTGETGTHSAKILEKLDTIPIALSQEAQHRAPKGRKSRDDNAVRGVKGDSNYCIEIFSDERGKWRSEVISTYQAYRIVAEFGEERLRDATRTQSGQPLIMRLLRDDIVQLTMDGSRALYRLCKFYSTGSMFFAGLNESNVDARVRIKEISYLHKTAGSLATLKAKHVAVDPTGRVSKARSHS